LSSSRDAIVNQINENGVGAGVYYPRLVHDYGCYQNHELITVDQTPVAQAVADSVISLPVHQFLSSDEVTRVAEVVNKVVTGY
jgi:dTDP-4-amino-4,6-dideoxygalactose transaminase